MYTDVMTTPASPEKIQSPLFILGMVALLTIGVSLVPASWFGIKPHIAQYAPLNLGSLATYDESEKDTDQDGTVSWKEFIASSLGVLPDEATTSAEISARDIAALNDPNNLTSSFTKNFYIAQVALKQNGLTNQTAQQEAVDSLLSQEASKIQTTTYAKSDIVLAAEDTPASLASYGNSLAVILTGVLSQQSMTDDLQGITKFIQEGDEADLIPLINDRRKAGDALNKLLKLRVPASAADAHLAAINAVGAYMLTLSNMAGAQDDPIRATFGLGKYLENATGVIKLFSSFSSFFTTKGVAFTSKDPGYVFVVGYTGK
jgi:hypothetical protein